MKPHSFLRTFCVLALLVAIGFGGRQLGRYVLAIAHSPAAVLR